MYTNSPAVPPTYMDKYAATSRDTVTAMDPFSDDYMYTGGVQKNASVSNNRSNVYQRAPHPEPFNQDPYIARRWDPKAAGNAAHPPTSYSSNVYLKYPEAPENGTYSYRLSMKLPPQIYVNNTTHHSTPGQSYDCTSVPDPNLKDNEYNRYHLNYQNAVPNSSDQRMQRDSRYSSNTNMYSSSQLKNEPEPERIPNDHHNNSETTPNSSVSENDVSVKTDPQPHSTIISNLHKQQPRARPPFVPNPAFDAPYFGQYPQNYSRPRYADRYRFPPNATAPSNSRQLERILQRPRSRSSAAHRADVSATPVPQKRGIEGTQCDLRPRLRITARSLGPIEAWRLMMSLKSGLLAEISWALDTITVLLHDDSTVQCFEVDQLHGLLDLIIELWIIYLKKLLPNLLSSFDVPEEIGKHLVELSFINDCHNISDNEKLLNNTHESFYDVMRRCLALANIVRSLSCIPSNHKTLSRHDNLLRITCCLLQSTDVSNDMLDTLREHALVILANISGSISLGGLVESTTLTLIDGLLNWAVSSATYANDPLRGAVHSSLTLRRISIETLAKISMNSSNTDYLVAVRPSSRLKELMSQLSVLISDREEPALRELALVLQANLTDCGLPLVNMLTNKLETVNHILSYIEDTLHHLQSPDQMTDSPISIYMLNCCAHLLSRLLSVIEKPLCATLRSRILNLVTFPFLASSGCIVSITLANVLFQLDDFSTLAT